MMDYTSNRKYFVQKNPAPWHITFAVMVLGVIILIFMGPRMYPLAFSLLAVGAVMEVVVLQKNVTDKYFESTLPDAAEIFKKEFEEAFVHEDMRIYHSHSLSASDALLETPEPIYGREYLFEASDFSETGIEKMIRRGSDSVARSSVVCFTGLLIEQKRISMMKKRVSMIDDKGDVQSFHIHYRDLSSAEIENRRLDCGLPSAHCTRLVLRDKSGEAVFELPMHDDMDIEEWVSRINLLIDKAQKEAVKAPASAI